jgi:hypothetical protein
LIASCPVPFPPPLGTVTLRAVQLTPGKVVPQVIATVPVNLLVGVTVIIELPLAPAVTGVAAPLTVNEPPLVTVKVMVLLATPPTVTMTLPVVAPTGTGATMLDALQLELLVGVAVVPLKVTVLVPCVAPKFEPAIVTDVPTGPEFGVRLVIDGAAAAVIVKVTAAELLGLKLASPL